MHVDHVWPEGLSYEIAQAPEAGELDSHGIQRAIDAVAKSGGGMVTVPAGNYLIGPIRLRSRVWLNLEPGAVLWGTPHLEHYFNPPLEEPMGLISDSGPGTNDLQAPNHQRINRLIKAVDAEGTGIVGGGTINAQSPQFFFPWLNRHREGELPRPKETVVFQRCFDVTLEGVEIINSCYWTVVLHECDGIRIEGLRLRNFEGPNADGIDLCGSRNATISNCRIHVGDDAICMKTSHPDHVVRNIAISNCLIRTLCNGIKIGTESVGDFEDIRISNLVISNADHDVSHAHGGVCLATMDGGNIRRVAVAGLSLNNVRCPFYIRGGKRDKLQHLFRKPRAGRIEGISLTDVRAANSRFPCYITGQAEAPIRSVFLRDIRIEKRRGAIDYQPPSPGDSPGKYPTPCLFGSADSDELPAYGLFQRNVRDIQVVQMRTHVQAEEVRPEWWVEADQKHSAEPHYYAENS